MVNIKDCKLWDVWVDSREQYMPFATTKNAAMRNVRGLIKKQGRNLDDCPISHIDYYDLTPNDVIIIES